MGIRKMDGKEISPVKDAELIVEGNEFMRIVDAQGKLLSRYTRDGTFKPAKIELPDSTIFPNGLYEGLYPQILSSLLESYVFNKKTDNPNYLSIWLDAQGHVLQTIDRSGYIKPTFLKLPQVALDQTRDSLQSEYFIPEKRESDKVLYRVKDAEGRVLLEILASGEFAPSLLKLPENTRQEIRDIVTQQSTAGLYNMEGVKPFPTSLIRIDLNGDIADMSKDKKVWMKASILGEELDVKVSKQGSSSWNMPKGQYSIDLYKNGKEFKLKIGNWVSQDGFHLKAYYIDAQHCLDIIANRLYEQMLLTKPFNEQRAWRLQNRADESMGSTSSKLADKIDRGALGHVDGFPVCLYMNGENQGIRTLRLKKHRDNYMMDKSNNKHIHFEMNIWQDMNIATPKWEFMEIRNPKGFDAGKEPSAGAVKKAIERLWAWSYNLTDATFLNEYKAYIDLGFWIDWILFCEFIYASDLVGKNTQWCTWDSKVWFPLPYDLDSIFGMLYDGTSIAHAPDKDYMTNEMYQQPIATMVSNHFGDKMKARYKELRDKGVFTTDNVTTLFADYMSLIGEEQYKLDYKLYPDMPSIPFASLNQKQDWTTKRITYLDNKYNY